MMMMIIGLRREGRVLLLRKRGGDDEVMVVVKEGHFFLWSSIALLAYWRLLLTFSFSTRGFVYFPFSHTRQLGFIRCKREYGILT